MRVDLKVTLKNLKIKPSLEKKMLIILTPPKQKKKRPNELKKFLKSMKDGQSMQMRQSISMM